MSLVRFVNAIMAPAMLFVGLGFLLFLPEEMRGHAIERDAFWLTLLWITGPVLLAFLCLANATGRPGKGRRDLVLMSLNSLAVAVTIGFMISTRDPLSIILLTACLVGPVTALVGMATSRPKKKRRRSKGSHSA